MGIINLGAGNKIVENAINHDISKHRPEIDLIFDLNIIPYPIKSGSFSRVIMLSVIEHLIPTPIETINEIWRILKVGGLLQLKYPLHTSPAIHDDPTHRWFLSAKSFHYVCPETELGQSYGFYSPYKWAIVESKSHKDLSQWLLLRKIDHAIS